MCTKKQCVRLLHRECKMEFRRLQPPRSPDFNHMDFFKNLKINIKKLIFALANTLFYNVPTKKCPSQQQ